MSTFRGLTSRRPFTLLGILLALLVIAAFVLVALNASTAGSVPTQSVVVATKDLQPRMPIDAASVETKKIPIANGYPAVYFSNTADVKGMIPLVTIGAGQAITSNEVVKTSQALGSQSEYLPIPAGYVAVTIPTSEQQGVADYIQPNDYISVIAIVSANGKVASKTIFTNIHVIKVGTNGSAAGSASVTSLTIVVTECEAEVIAWFLQSAALKYTLESYQDYLHSTTQEPDPKCPTVNSAQGQTLQSIMKAYPSLF